MTPGYQFGISLYRRCGSSPCSGWNSTVAGCWCPSKGLGVLGYFCSIFALRKMGQQWAAFGLEWFWRTGFWQTKLDAGRKNTHVYPLVKGTFWICLWEHIWSNFRGEIKKIKQVWRKEIVFLYSSCCDSRKHGCHEELKPPCFWNFKEALMKHYQLLSVIVVRKNSNVTGLACHWLNRCYCKCDVADNTV